MIGRPQARRLAGLTCLPASYRIGAHRFQDCCRARARWPARVVVHEKYEPAVATLRAQEFAGRDALVSALDAAVRLNRARSGPDLRQLCPTGRASVPAPLWRPRIRTGSLLPTLSEPQSASGPGLNWMCTARGIAPLPLSLSHGVRSPFVLHSPRPFQPAFGSSMRPSRPLA